MFISPFLVNYMVEVGDFMIFEVFTKEDINYIDDDYKLLDNEIIDKFDKKGIENRFKELLIVIHEQECKYLNFIIPSLTSNYEFKPEKFVNNKSDPTAKVAIELIETEKELSEAIAYLKLIYDKSLSYYEKVFFVDYFLLKKSVDLIRGQLNIGTDKYYSIKNSCLVKLALGLNWKNIEQ